MAKPSKPQGVKTRNDLTAEFVRSVFSYDPTTGILRWRHRNDITPTHRDRWNQRYAGTAAGDASSPDRLAVSLNTHAYCVHRLIWLLVTGKWPTHYIDHKDGNPHNNRWNNLREATPRQNQANIRRNKNNKSGFKGVSWNAKNKNWRAQIKDSITNRYLGSFSAREEAHAAYCKAAEELRGEFAAKNYDRHSQKPRCS